MNLEEDKKIKGFWMALYCSRSCARGHKRGGGGEERGVEGEIYEV